MRVALVVACGLWMAGAAWGQWQSWTEGEKVADGLWTWRSAGQATWVSVEQSPPGVTRIGVYWERPEVKTPQQAEVAPGEVRVEGLPALSFGYQESRLRVQLTASSGECFWGLGEKYNAVNQRGKRVNMWVDDGYRSLGDKTYLPVPMFLSSAGYGLYLDCSRRSVFDLASDGQTVSIEVDSPEAVLYLWSGRSPGELMRRYCQITGFPEAPPEWAFGIWLSRSSYSSQAEVLAVARRWRALELPLSLFNIEGWKGDTWLTFDKARFPDPRQMIRELHSYGWKVMLWNTHNLPPEDPNYAYGDEHGYFVKGLDGKTYNVPEGYGRGGCLDVTNPEAVKWWNSLYAPLVEMGVDALFNDITNYLDDDFGQQRAGRMVFSNGKTTEEMHNLYWLLFNKATYEYMKQKTGDDTVLRVAGGWAGQQKYSTVWAGDSATTWQFMQRDIRALLSAGWSGIPYFGYDIPGFSAEGNPPTTELYIRWVQFGALSPLMQFHTTARPEPWHYGDEAVQALRQWGWVREYFRPYLYSLALEAEATGAPMARSLAWEYPHDPTAATIEDQFFLGRDLLIAPVCSPGTQRRVYLPEGHWMDAFDGSLYRGPVWTEAQAPLDHLPVYMREGAIIPVKLSAALTIDPSMRERHVKALEIWPPVRSGSSRAVWRWKGRSAAVTCNRSDLAVTLRAPEGSVPAGTILRFEVGPPESVRVNGKGLKEITEAEIAAGDKAGYCYRKSEQVCFVNPGERWNRVTVVEKHGQLCFENWSSPSRIAANAGPARVEVSLPLAATGHIPTLTYSCAGKTATVTGQRAKEAHRWRFLIPLTFTRDDQHLTWRVAVQARTGVQIQSRPRVTVVQVPVTVQAPATMRLADHGVLRVRVVGRSERATRGRIWVTGPAGVTFAPAEMTYVLPGGASSRELAFRYRATGTLGLGEHEFRVHHKIAQTELRDTIVLAARPFRWHVVGPFIEDCTWDNWLTGFRTPHPPETGLVDLTAEYDACSGKVGWKDYPEEWIGEDGMVDIERLCGKVDMANAYLYTRFEAPSEREVLLKVGSDDALMLWVNGVKVHEFAGARAAARDQESVKVTLRAGTNEVLAKVFDLMDAWRFYLRVTDLSGQPIGDLGR